MLAIQIELTHQAANLHAMPIRFSSGHGVYGFEAASEYYFSKPEEVSR